MAVNFCHVQQEFATVYQSINQITDYKSVGTLTRDHKVVELLHGRVLVETTTTSLHRTRAKVTVRQEFVRSVRRCKMPV